MKTPTIMRPVLALFKRKATPPPEVRYQIVHRDVCRMTLEEWRDTAELCKLARNALFDPVVRQMLDVLRTEHLANYSPTGPMTIEDRAIMAARAEGYGIALNNFESLARHEKRKEPLEETFESTEP